MIVKCKECGKEISNKADKCPNCGYKQSKGCLGTLLICFLAVLILSIYVSYPDKKNYDQIITSPPQEIIQKPKEQAISASKWLTSTEKSPIDDSTNAYASIDAELPVIGWPNTINTPSLIIRCKEGKTSVYINTGLRAKNPSGDYDGANITIRIDEKKSESIRVSESTDEKSLFFPNPIKFSKSLIGHKKLLFEFTPFNSSPSMTNFDITELEQNIKEIRKNCKW